MWPLVKPRLRVVIVCTANICRSPAAEAMLRHHLNKEGLSRLVAVASAGTAVGSPGIPPDPRVVTFLTERGIKSRGLRTKPLEERMLTVATHVWTMENGHREEICRGFPGLGVKAELLDFDQSEIPDPYFGNREGVQRVMARIEEVCVARSAQLAATLD